MKKKSVIKHEEKDNVLLLTRKVDDKGKIVDLKNNKIANKKKESQLKKNVEKKEDKEINLTIKDNKNLNKTTELAVIIKKLKGIRDKKLNKNKKSKKNNKEIRKIIFSAHSNPTLLVQKKKGKSTCSNEHS